MEKKLSWLLVLGLITLLLPVLASAEMVVNNMWLVIGVSIAILNIGIVFLGYRDTKRKSGRWGANIKPFNVWRNKLFGWSIGLSDIVADVYCPNCGNQLPKKRAPKSLKQFLWGGWTCEYCGTEVDKWGNIEQD